MALKFLPPGFRFHPTDVELILYYLKRKIMGKKLHYEAIAEVNIYQFSPWDLPDKSCLKSKDLEWFFFCPRERKYATGSRVKRATENGYWKTTGKDRSIRYKDRTVGTVKTLVFHLGHAPKGERTDWVIYEYKIFDDKLAAEGIQDTYVLCKVFKKDGMGPKNGAQYGAPFDEADWADDCENQAISFACDCPQLTAPMQTEEGTLVIGSTFSPGDPSGSCLVAQGLSLSAGGAPSEVVAQGLCPSAGGIASEVVVNETDDNDIVRLLSWFTDEDMLPSNDNGINQGGQIGNIGNEPLPFSDGNDIYDGLDDLNGLGLTDGGILDFSVFQNDEYYINNMPFQENSAYIELDDLLPPLDCSNGVATTDKLSNNEIFGTPGYENIQPPYSGARFSSTGQFAPCSNEIPPPPNGSYEHDDYFDLFQPLDQQQIYEGPSASFGLHFNLSDLANDMERGSRKLDCYSRFMECNPAHQIPTAAEHLARIYTSYGGSSIHIKAEVTHGAGECTNEALSVMMGESGSCWCYYQKLQSCLVEFRCELISDIISQGRHYCSCNYNHHHHHINEDSVTIFSLMTRSGNLINSFVNIVKTLISTLCLTTAWFESVLTSCYVSFSFCYL